MSDEMPAPKVPIIAFTAGKGGCGKTTLALNFAKVLHSFGLRVLLVDCDLNNQGATGAFSESIKSQEDEGYLTTHALLYGADDERSTIAIQERFHFLPAQAPSDPPAARATGDDLERQIVTFRDGLHALAASLEVDCIVLDCFCGIDALTTCTIGAADEALLVNEPDLITFTGTLNLLRHLRQEFERMQRAPRLNFVINRMRPPHTVPSLVKLYADNIGHEVPGGVACHVPFNERVMRNFGKHPFVSDLLPKSLFVRKLELLSYVVLRDVAPKLLPQRIRDWSQYRLKKLYLQSVDPAAVDAETLVLQLTRFAAMSTFLGVVAVVIRETVEDPDVAGYSMVLLAAMALMSLWPLGAATWSASRFNWTMGSFSWRAASFRTATTEQLSHRIATFGYLAISAALAAFVACVVVVGLVVGSFALDELAELRKAREGGTLSAARAQMSLDSPVARVVDMSGRHVAGDFVLQWNNSRRLVGDERGQGRVALVKDTVLSNVVFGEGVLNKTHLATVTFDNCVFRGGGVDFAETSESVLEIAGVQWTNVRLSAPLVGEGSHYQTITFADSTLRDVVIEVNGGVRVVLTGAKIESARDGGPGVTVVNLTRSTAGGLGRDALALVPDVRVGVEQGMEGSVAPQVGVSVLPRGDEHEEELTRKIEARKSLLQQIDRLGDPTTPGKLNGRSAYSERTNLVELYLARGRSKDIASARALLDELDAALKDKLGGEDQDDGILGSYGAIEGYSRMLRVLLEMRERSDHKGSYATASRWSEWLRQHPRSPDEPSRHEGSGPLAPWGWGFDSWNKYVVHELSDGSAGRMCYETVQASAEGKITTAQFDERFMAACTRGEPKAAPTDAPTTPEPAVVTPPVARRPSKPTSASIAPRKLQSTSAASKKSAPPELAPAPSPVPSPAPKPAPPPAAPTDTGALKRVHVPDFLSR